MLKEKAYSRDLAGKRIEWVSVEGIWGEETEGEDWSEVVNQKRAVKSPAEL